MEGNRHERVALLITAYIIGFITAFIAYGLTGTSKDPVTIVSAQSSQQTSQAAAARNPQVDTVDMYKAEDGLYVAKTDREEVLISLNYNTVDDEAYLGVDGVHYSVPFMSISPDENQIYYCEQPTAESETCKPFIYNIAEELIYPVPIGAERTEFEIATHNVSWSDDNQLVY